jgi:hypothetical protein
LRHHGAWGDEARGKKDSGPKLHVQTPICWPPASTGLAEARANDSTTRDAGIWRSTKKAGVRAS